MVIRTLPGKDKEFLTAIQHREFLMIDLGFKVSRREYDSLTNTFSFM